MVGSRAWRGDLGVSDGLKLDADLESFDDRRQLEIIRARKVGAKPCRTISVGGEEYGAYDIDHHSRNVAQWK
eukprot:1099551-Amorphochlora_amoeboformis.AAC.1